MAVVEAASTVSANIFSGHKYRRRGEALGDLASLISWSLLVQIQPLLYFHVILGSVNALVAAFFRGMAGDAREGGSRIAAHLPTIYALAKQSIGPIVELGVGRGWSTAALLAGAVETGRKLYSYDWNGGARGVALRSMGLSEKVGFATSWEFKVSDSSKAAANWAPESVGLWFLDTTHTYAKTKHELEAWWPKMLPNGIMCGHDYLLHERWGSQAGVKTAVDEFAKNHADRVRLQTMLHDDGFFVLWPMDQGAPPA